MTLRQRFLEGHVIPAHPLALTAERKLDEDRQRRLTRYYVDSGAGGIAVGVHTTQFAIRDPRFGLFRPVLELAVEEMPARDIIRIAGACGDTRQAAFETGLAADLGYDAVLLSLAALKDATNQQLLEHTRVIAGILPVVGFYLQPAVGGRVLTYSFWRGFAEIENVVAVKIAPFNRYQTIEVVRAVADSGRGPEIALYTGNDDHILLDLLTPFSFNGDQTLRIVGGLLGHWAVNTRIAVEHLALVKSAREISPELLTLAAQITETNAAIFDAVHDYRGCIAGIHEVLRRQERMAGCWCLDDAEELSPGQQDEITRVMLRYPHLFEA